MFLEGPRKCLAVLGVSRWFEAVLGLFNGASRKFSWFCTVLWGLGFLWSGYVRF